MFLRYQKSYVLTFFDLGLPIWVIWVRFFKIGHAVQFSFKRRFQVHSIMQYLPSLLPMRTLLLSLQPICQEPARRQRSICFQCRYCPCTTGYSKVCRSPRMLTLFDPQMSNRMPLINCLFLSLQFWWLCSCAGVVFQNYHRTVNSIFWQGKLH